MAVGLLSHATQYLAMASPPGNELPTYRYPPKSAAPAAAPMAPYCNRTNGPRFGFAIALANPTPRVPRAAKRNPAFAWLIIRTRAINKPTGTSQTRLRP